MSAVITSVAVGVAGVGVQAYSAYKSAKGAKQAASSAASGYNKAAVDAARVTASATKAAAEASASAQRYAADLAQKQYDQSRADNLPWLEQGTAAINKLGPGVVSGELNRPFELSDFHTDPGYSFRMDEGIKALDRSASSSGNLLSGSQAKAITGYGQNLASNEYQNAYNRYVSNQNTVYNQLAGVAGMGQTTANTLGTLGANYANSVGNQAVSTAAINGINATNSANTIGGYYLNAASNAGNAAIAAQNAQASSYAGYGDAFGSLAKILGNYSKIK